MMARDIIIRRADGKIPGLLELNIYLVEKYGLNIALVADDVPHNANAPMTFVGLVLSKATVENDMIVPGEVLLTTKGAE